MVDGPASLLTEFGDAAGPRRIQETASRRLGVSTVSSHIVHHLLEDVPKHHHIVESAVRLSRILDECCQSWCVHASREPDVRVVHNEMHI